MNLNLILVKLGVELLEQANLLAVELNHLLPVGFLRVKQAVGTIGLVITANFVELLTAVTNELAGFVDIIELFGELWQAEFTTYYYLVSDHVVTSDHTAVVPFYYLV